MRSPSELRLQKELAELDVPKCCSVCFTELPSLNRFIVTVSPEEGFWSGGHFDFDCRLTPAYPYDPPKVKCLTKVFHPNIDAGGNVCLNILRLDWRPVMGITAIIIGFLNLFLEPCFVEPLNQAAADLFKRDRKHFEYHIKTIMAEGNSETPLLEIL